MLLWILCRDLQLMTHVTVAAINAADCSSGKKLSTYVGTARRRCQLLV